MTGKETVSTVDTNQIATNEPVNMPAAQGPTGAPTANPPQAGPSIEQAFSSAGKSPEQGDADADSEQAVWEARYSMKNFIGRLILRVLLTAAWIALAVYTWGKGHAEAHFITILLGIFLGILWLGLFYRIIHARYGHYYRLTNRRLFVSTGLMRRRRDQMELLRVEDVFTRQTLIERWLSLGTVVVVSQESQLPTIYLLGVDDPKGVMDMVWKYARAERTGKAVQIDEI